MPQRSALSATEATSSGDLAGKLAKPEATYSRISPKVVSTPEPSVLHPTPMQVVLRQETPKRALKAAPDGFEVPWIDQLVPFHFSARV